ncbi:MAG: M48 family metallopeptidase [Betaproteobacteria bacterium]
MSRRHRRSLSAVALAALAVLLPSGCATTDSPQPTESKDVARSALGGFSIGGINVGAAVGAAQSTVEATREITEPEEVAMGKGISEGLLGAAPLVKNAQQQRFVNNIGRWLALNSGRPDLPWHFGIIETASVNAFATPGGNVFVTRGLVARTTTESELAGVLAHEIAHVVQKHHLADIKKNATKGLLLDLASLKGGGLTGEAARAVARVGLEGFVRGLSREDEIEADRIGVVIAARSGYEPFGLVAVLQTLNAMPQSDDAMALFLKTHPSPADRLRALEAEIPAWYETLAKPNPALVRYTTLFKPKP